MSFNFLKSNQTGQTLLEIMISLTVMTIALIAIVSRATDAVKNANFSRNKVLAARFAQEGVEWARQQRDRLGWFNLKNEVTSDGDPVTYCVPDLSENISCRPSTCTTITVVVPVTSPCTSVISGTVFTREITFDFVDPDSNPLTENRFDVQVVASWTDNIGIHNAQYSTVLSEWVN